jgi:hypothetical protein
MTTSLAGFRAHATARGNSAPASASDADANAALQRAVDYIAYTYVVRFLDPSYATLPVVDDATYVAAGLELATPGLFSKTFTPAEAKVLTRLDTISWTPVEVKQGDPNMFSPRSSLIEAMLFPYMPGNLSFGFMAVGYE